MEILDRLRAIKIEVEHMDFSYRNVHRIMYLAYQTKELFETNAPLPNKDIALHQAQKVIKNELMQLIKSGKEEEIKESFFEMIKGFKLMLTYIS